LITAALLIAAAYLGYQEQSAVEVSGAVEVTSNSSATRADSDWRSGEQVRGAGSVVRVLADDNDGSRHQRFILKLSSGRTVLIAHNIDLAPRVRSIMKGDSVTFFGQFESSSQGGVVHWTHKDPQKRHLSGWLEHRGIRYE
jgi:hypothetical protein